MKQIEQRVSWVSILIRKLPDSHFYQGTPLFMARAVGRGGPLPAVFAAVPGIPDSPGPYGEVHPDRVKKFPGSNEEIIINPKRVGDESQKSQLKRWRHELQHDAESVFWLLLYWAMVVQPEECHKETIDLADWTSLLGNFETRERYVDSLSLYATSFNITHPFYYPLRPLIQDLAAILVIDSHWLEAPDPRKDTFYVTEAFQRLILKFMIENRGEEFMDHRVEKTFRKVERMRHPNGEWVTVSQNVDSVNQSVDSGMRPVCGSVNFCLFLLLCLWVCLQDSTDEDVDMADDIVTIDDTESDRDG